MKRTRFNLTIRKYYQKNKNKNKVFINILLSIIYYLLTYSEIKLRNESYFLKNNNYTEKELSKFNLTLKLESKQRTIFIVGDSTAANKDILKEGIEHGWGMLFQKYFDKEKIIVDNHAENGYSSLSFIKQGNWKKVLRKIKKGDFVIIQFGHNDEKDDKSVHTDVGSSFDYNLEKYCNETKNYGGIPILMNSIVRRKFAKENKVEDDDLTNILYPDNNKKEEKDILIDTHGDYRLVPKKIAKKLNVYFVDANKITHDLEQGLGVEGSKKLHMWFIPGE